MEILRLFRFNVINATQQYWLCRSNPSDAPRRALSTVASALLDGSTLSGQRCASSLNWQCLCVWRIFGFSLEIDWNPCEEIGRDSTASVSTISGGSVSYGLTIVPMMWKSSITTKAGLIMTKIAPVSLGEMLQAEFLKPLGLTPYRLAKDIDVSATRVCDIVSGKRAVTAETDLLLCRYFGLSDGWWLAVQSHHDTQVARREFGKRLDSIRHCTLLDQAAAH